MRIIKFIIENYKALKGKKEFEPKGSSFMLLAANGKGKTSAGRAIMDILTNNVPSKPVSDGENKGYVEFTFDDGKKLLAKFSENGTTKLELLSPEGLKIATPKDVIRKLAGTGMDFSIDEFLSMAPKPRRELLEKIAGVDLTHFNQQEKELEEARRVANADAKAAEARVRPFDEKLAEKEVVDTTEAVARLKEMTEANAARQKVETGISQREARLEEIEKQIKALVEESQQKSEEIKKGQQWLEQNPGFSDAEIEGQEELISQSDAIREAKRMKAEKETFDEKKRRVETYDTQIKVIRKKKDDAIKAAKLPADGLAFDLDSDTLLIDGLPFESNQIAQSRKLIAAVQIAASMLGEIKYLHFDGAALDRASADKILEWAEKHDLQLCLERPLWEGGGEVKMELIESHPEKNAISTEGMKTLNDLPASVQKKDNQDAVRKANDTPAEVTPAVKEIDTTEPVNQDIKVKKVDTSLPW